MPPAEVLYRIHHKASKIADECYFRFKSLTITTGDFLDLSSGYNLTNDFKSVTLSTHLNQGSIKHLIKQANRYLCDEIFIFGDWYDYGHDINWHLEPKAKKQWPQKFWSKVNIRDGFTCGAPKFVWEANRLYGLPILGLSYLTTNQKKYADKILKLIDSWIKANFYPIGVNWTSGIELAVRVANIIWALSFLKGYELSTHDKKNINYLMFTHAYHLYKYPSKYSSNNNHAIAEAFALFLIGVCFPYFKEAKKWRKFGQGVLEQEGLRQILSDGGSYEYSTTYLSFVFDFFLLFKIVCDQKDIEYNKELDQRLEKSCDYIHSVMDKNGNIPNVGDQDSAVLVNFGLDNHHNFQSILNTGSILFNRPEFQRNNFPDLKTKILLGDKIKNTKPIKQKHRTGNNTALLKKSGLGIIRSNVKEREILFIGNATPLGMPPLYAHGHLDALSVYLSIDGREILVDPGTYLYHSGGKWRRYFRSTAAHNTIRVNGQELTPQLADFMFGKSYNITEHFLEKNVNSTTWIAAHDAYQKLNPAVDVKRNVNLDISKCRIDIDDELTGNDNFLVEQFFHFHPNCSVELENNKARIQCTDIRITMLFGPETQVERFKGSEEPLLGWFSKKFNQIEKSWTIVAKSETKDKNPKFTTQIIL